MMLVRTFHCQQGNRITRMMLTQDEGMTDGEVNSVINEWTRVKETMMSRNIQITGFPTFSDRQDRQLFEMQMDPKGTLQGTNSIVNQYAAGLY